jgi:hypothetical protein
MRLISSLAIAGIFSGCVSVWPKHCDMSWRGTTVCSCKNNIELRVVRRSKVFIVCDGVDLPMQISGTGVIVEGN